MFETTTQVSMLTTDVVSDQAVMPTCTYTVKKGSQDGEPIRYARIGEPVFHVWVSGQRGLVLSVSHTFGVGMHK
jgi:hypothetical protein